jgi:Fe-S-cluster containining protein
MRSRLLAIYDDVERRTRATGESHAWWPCRRGCDTCCRRLADVPRLVRTEWELLQEGLALLPPAAQADIRGRIDDLASAEREGRLPSHITCPMLDEAEGACRVYDHRPGACRTYGFYVERGLGLHCGLITAAVGEHEKDDAPVLWGNQEGVDYALARLAGAPLPLTAWLSSSSCESSLPEPLDPEPDPSSPSSAI